MFNIGAGVRKLDVRRFDVGAGGNDAGECRCMLQEVIKVPKMEVISIKVPKVPKVGYPWI